jgi:hypothetical protein
MPGRQAPRAAHDGRAEEGTRRGGGIFRFLAGGGAPAWIAAVVAVIGAFFGGRYSSTPAPQPTVYVTVPAGTGSPQGNSAPAGSASAGVGPAQEYANMRFTLPGGGSACSSAIGTYGPSRVIFTASRPQVTSNGTDLSASGDFWVSCDANSASIVFGVDQVAKVTGDPDAAACNAAVNQAALPSGTSIPYAQLTPGTTFCILGGVDPGTGQTDKSQLVRVTVVSRNLSTFSSTWTATGWSAPSSS